MKSNKKIYESEKAVKDYETHNYLLGAEQKILTIIKEYKINGSMLDIGVGAGRTTSFFAKEFENYTGIDYSAPMIELCNNKFQQNNVSFIHADARKLDTYFEENSFDFVLFSFNGIDCLDYNDRLVVLQKIKQVLKPDGFFAFSTHNIYNFPLLFSIQWPRNPFKLLKELKRWRGVQKLNKPMNELLKLDYTPVIDGDMDFQAEYLYFKPEYQFVQLNDFHFQEIKMYTLKNGNEISSFKNIEKINDPWIYYLCKNKKLKIESYF